MPPVYRHAGRAYLRYEDYAAAKAASLSRPVYQARENISLGIITDAGEVPLLEERRVQTLWDEPTERSTEAIAPEDRTAPKGPRFGKLKLTESFTDRSAALKKVREVRGTLTNAAGGGYTVTWVTADVVDLDAQVV